MSNILKLKTPKTSFGETFTELKFRKPVGSDIAHAGFPFHGNGNGQSVMDAAAVHRLISRLGNVPLELVDILEAEDWTAASVVVLGFFGNKTKVSPTDTST